MNNDFGANKTPIKERAYGGSYFKDIYSGINRKQYRKLSQELNELKNIHQNYYFSNYYDVNINKYKVKLGTSL